MPFKCYHGGGVKKIRKDRIMTEKQRLEEQLAQCRKDKQGIADNEAEIEQKIKDMEVTYSIGDRFNPSNGNGEYILASVAAGGFLDMINISSGERWNTRISPSNLTRITKSEFKPLGCSFTRYYDHRKGCKV